MSGNTYEDDVVRAERPVREERLPFGLKRAPKGTIPEIDTAKLPQSKLRDRPKET